MADHSASSSIHSRPIRATVAGNRLELLETGRARFDRLLELIAGARDSLKLLFYIYSADSAGAAVRDALADAARRGVRVSLLLDGYGCAALKPDFFQPIAEAGGTLCLFHPSYGRRYLVRNHQKLVVADGRTAIIGGANIEETYLSDEGPKHWRDLWLSIEGPAAAHADGYFDALFRWTTAKGAKLGRLRRIVRRHSQHRGPLQWRFSGPLSVRNSWPAAPLPMTATCDASPPLRSFWPLPSQLRALSRNPSRDGPEAASGTRARYPAAATADTSSATGVSVARVRRAVPLG